MARSKSSKSWLNEHFNDEFVKKAQHLGVRSRAYFKLEEIDKKEKLIKQGHTVVDLGAAPGGWTEYAMQKVGDMGQMFALDILPMDPFADVQFIQGDFTEQEVYEELLSAMNNARADLVISDMAPNLSGMSAIDQPKAAYLCELAYDFACQTLNKDGCFLVKVFHGAGFEELLANCRQSFKQVKIIKPKASRDRSKETYLLARQFKL